MPSLDGPGATQDHMLQIQRRGHVESYILYHLESRGAIDHITLTWALELDRSIVAIDQ